MTSVVNLRYKRGEVYVGRRDTGMHFGNPFSHQRGTLAKVRVASREEAIARFRTWLEGATDQDVEPERRAWILTNVPLLRGKVLMCYCKPKLCHGDVLAAMADEEAMCTPAR